MHDLAGETEKLIKAFRRELPWHRTRLENDALRKAAMLTARENLAAGDANISPDAVARIASVARRARVDLQRLAAAHKARQKPKDKPKVDIASLMEGTPS